MKNLGLNPRSTSLHHGASFGALSRIIRDNLCVHRLQRACFNRSRLKTCGDRHLRACTFPLLTFP